MKNPFKQAIEDNFNRKWHDFRQALDKADISVAWDPAFQGEVRRVFVFSDFVAQVCVQHPRILVDLHQTGDLTRSYPTGRYRGRLRESMKDVAGDMEYERTLRLFRHREMMRIAWRDLLGKSDLRETLRDLSDLADACIDHALSFIHENQCKALGCPTGPGGSPMRLSVVGMGKLGGQELNFSSDVDLIFVYPDEGETRGGDKSISNEKFFTILCRKLLKTLGSPTRDGFVFRVDTRLRPYGDNGPLVMGFDALEEYCQQQGREWERYAWIKARVVAGDKQGGQALLDRLKPFVYRRYLDFGAFESMRDMKEKIELEVRRKGMAENIKLGPGGIREIEFFGQIFQLIRGGVTPPLQERRIRRVLSNMLAEGYIPGDVHKELDAAYVFLRRVENRLQAVSDAQTHTLHKEPLQRHLLALSMNFNSEEDLMAALDHHRSRVTAHFTLLLKPHEGDETGRQKEKGWESIWLDLMDSPKTTRFLEREGFQEPGRIIELLNHLRGEPAVQAMGHDGRRRLNRLIPMILKAVRVSENQAAVLGRILDLLLVILGRTSYLALLLENPDSLAHLVRLAGSSPFMASFLARHPVLLDELLDPRTLYVPPERRDVEKELKRRMGRLEDDLEYQMEELCVFKQAQVLRVGAADVILAMPLMKVSDRLTDIAEVVVNHVLRMAWDYLVAKHGKPVCMIENKACEQGFAVISYGKFGGFELGYGSDLDLVFLHAGTDAYTQKEGRSIHSSQFFARLGQRVVHILTSATRAGTLYETDTRLRPSGSSGILVSHIDAYREYQLNDAWTWEHQAIIKARAIGGDPVLVKRFEQIRRQVIAMPRDKAKLKADVRDMRKKMRAELARTGPGIFDLKQSRGGIVDIEFLVQYLVLCHAPKYKDLLSRTDIVRLLYALHEFGIIDGTTANLLRRAYLVYRAVAHKLSLQMRPPHIPADRFQSLVEKIEGIWFKYLGGPENNVP